MKTKFYVLLSAFAFVLICNASVLAQVGKVEKDQPGKITNDKDVVMTQPPHQYAITEIDAGNFQLARVRVENKGKGRAKAGKVWASVTIVEGSSFPPKFVTYAQLEKPSGSRTGWTGLAALPALKSGESVWVEVLLEPCKPCGLIGKPPDTADKKYSYGVEVKATNADKMANGKLESIFADFLPWGFFNK
jgi:hypothetical protein